MPLTNGTMLSAHTNKTPLRTLKVANHKFQRQRGVAIITALLIVTIAATVSITISTQLQLDVRRTSNMIAQDQAMFYLLAAEEWSQRILREDKKDNNFDALSETWAFELPPLPVTGGSIQGKISDLHSCININSLVTGNIAGGNNNNSEQNNVTVNEGLEFFF